MNKFIRTKWNRYSFRWI